MSDPHHTSYAEKFERLLGLFPHPDRQERENPEERAWRMVELTDATHGGLSAAYLSALRKGRNKRPGMDYLDMIAKAMDFPFELWLTEPEQWPTMLAREEEQADGASYAELLEDLFATITNRKTGKSFTNSEVAERTNGQLTEEDIEQLRKGNFTRPSRAELMSLSNAFGVDVAYWMDPSSGSPVLDKKVQDILWLRDDERRYEMLAKTFEISDADVDALLALLDRWQARDTG